MKEKFAKLIDVKSIVTMMLTLVFCILALLGAISAQEFMTIFVVVIGFYFGTQAQKRAHQERPAEPTGVVPESSDVIEKLEVVNPEATEDKLKPPDKI